MSAYTGGAASGAPSAKPPDNTTTLIVGSSFNGNQLVGGQSLGGWESIRITRGLDRMPSDFEIALTEKYPGQAAQVSASPGQPCQVLIGKDVVITGYVDDYIPSISAGRHEVRIRGRSKCEDLVDCSITPSNLTGMSMTTSSLLLLAQQLAKPHGITASSLTGDNVPVGLPGTPAAPVTFQAVLTETPYEILERVARYVGVLLYDGTDGNLIIANVGTGTHASGFAQGGNVESASVAYTMRHRYRTYLPQAMPFTAWGTPGAANATYAPATDAAARAGREVIIVSEQFAYSPGLAVRRAQWEAARRIGRSKAFHVTCDSWRDRAGTLWSPNFYAPINLPVLKLVTTTPWVIGEVTFRRDEKGTHADLLLMPPAAFQPEPDALAPFSWSNQPPAPAGGAAANPNLPPQDGVS